MKDGRRKYVHERLRSARHSLEALVRDSMMFTFVEMAEERGGRWGSPNNVIERGVSSQVRLMLQNHRGLTKIRRAKTAFWWC